jgi:hypothetical protein
MRLAAFVRTALAASALAGCGATATIEPPAPALRQRMQAVALRVKAAAAPRWQATSEPVEGAAAGAGHGAAVGAAASAAVALSGCQSGNDANTCAATLTLGILALPLAVVGGALYGAIRAGSAQEIAEAAANLEAAVGDLAPAADLRTHLLASLRRRVPIVSLVDDAEDAADAGPAGVPHPALILAIRVEEFALSRAGRIAPDLDLDFSVFAGLYDAPDVGLLYQRRWRYFVALGDYFRLTAERAVKLREALAAAIGKMADAVVDDLFVSSDIKPLATKRVAGEVVTVSGGAVGARGDWHADEERRAACGDAEAQLALGRRHASVEVQVYGRRAAPALIEAYKWLRLSAAGGNATAAAELDALKARMTAEQIAAAERRASGWTQQACPAQDEPATGVHPVS